MNLLYDRITRFFLHAADPYSTTDLPPKTTVWAYIASHMEPLRRVLIASVVVTIFAAGVEVWLIRYAGLLVDKLTSSDTGTFWAEEGTGLALAALVVLIIRPVSQFLRLAVNDIALDCNAANLARWRAYNHLILQSVGWFQEDLSGRTSTRLVEIGNNVADTFHKSLNAVGFGLVYMIGVVALMAGVEIWLALPLLIWLALYIGVLVWVIPRMITAQHRFQSAKSALVGTVVDGFSNFDTLKLFAPKNQIANELQSGCGRSAWLPSARFQRQLPCRSASPQWPISYWTRFGGRSCESAPSAKPFHLGQPDPTVFRGRGRLDQNRRSGHPRRGSGQFACCHWNGDATSSAAEQISQRQHPVGTF